MMLRIAALTALVAVASATCPKVVGTSALAGTKCGAAVDQSAGRAGWITKINAYTDGKCITGIKPTYGYNSGGAQLLGHQTGAGKDFKLFPASGEFVVKADVAVGSCLECITMHTNKGRSFSVGTCHSAKTTVSAPEGAHLFALKGFFGAGCAAPAVQMVWGTEACEAPVAAPVVEAPAAAEVEAPAEEPAVEAPAEAQAPAEVVTETVTETQGEAEATATETPAPASDCTEVVYFYGSNGLACDTASSKVVATGTFAKFSPFLMLTCKDLGACEDGKEGSDNAAYAKCKWAVCKPAKKSIPSIPKFEMPNLASKMTMPTFELPKKPDFSSMIPKLPEIQKPDFASMVPKLPSVPQMTVPTVQIPDVKKAATDAVQAKINAATGLASSAMNAANGLKKSATDAASSAINAKLGMFNMTGN